MLFQIPRPAWSAERQSMLDLEAKQFLARDPLIRQIEKIL
jgi:hypothetical protein